jgi:hypothetical protein
MSGHKLTAAQRRALDLITRNGRYGVGFGGGIRRATANALVRAGLAKFDLEYSWGHLRQYLVPSGKSISQLI